MSRFKHVIFGSVLVLIALLFWLFASSSFKPLSQEKVRTELKSQTEEGVNGVNLLTQEQMRIKLKSQAIELIEAIAKHDFDKWADLTWPAVIDANGGREKWMAAMKKLADLGDKSDAKELNKVGEPKKIAKGVENHYGIIPIKTEITHNGVGTVFRKFLIGVSSDGGKNWRFSDGMRGRFRVKQLFPDFPDEIELPKD